MPNNRAISQYLRQQSYPLIALSGPVLFLLVATIITTGTCESVAPVDPDPMCDDGWRLTVDGWEHISTWPATPISSAAVDNDQTDANLALPSQSLSLKERIGRDGSYSPLAKPQFDLHPAAWGMLQLFVALIALSFFPGSDPAADSSRALDNESAATA